MGSFAELLKPISGGISAGAGLISAVDGILGISQKRQMKQQKELQEHAAELNYNYGEKSAENAFERQMRAYEQTYSDNTLQNQVNQAKDAGLSVGMLYGGGAQGGGEGNLSGGTQGTGAAGIAAGQAPQAGLAMQGLALAQQGAKTAAEIDLLKSQKELNEANADAAKESAGLSAETAETERQIRVWAVNKMREDGLEKFLQNMITKYQMSENFTNGYTYEEAGAWGLFQIEINSKMAQEMRLTIQDMSKNIEVHDAVIAELASRTDLNISQEDLNKARKALEDNKVQYYLYEITTARIHAAAHKLEAETGASEYNLKRWHTIWQHNFDQTIENKRIEMWKAELAERLNELKLQLSVGLDSKILDLFSGIIQASVGASVYGAMRNMGANIPQPQGSILYQPTSARLGDTTWRR